MSGGRSYIAHNSRNSIAVVWAMLMGGVNKGMIDFCTQGVRPTRPPSALMVT